jgi:hypothetical protein
MYVAMKECIYGDVRPTSGTEMFKLRETKRCYWNYMWDEEQRTWMEAMRKNRPS